MKHGKPTQNKEQKNRGREKSTQVLCDVTKQPRPWGVLSRVFSLPFVQAHGLRPSLTLRGENRCIFSWIRPLCAREKCLTLFHNGVKKSLQDTFRTPELSCLPFYFRKQLNIREKKVWLPDGASLASLPSPLPCVASAAWEGS